MEFKEGNLNCQDSNKSEIKDKFQNGLYLKVLKRFLPRGTDRDLKSLKHLPENSNLAIEFCLSQSITEMYQIRTNERVLSLEWVIKTPSIYVKRLRH